MNTNYTERLLLKNKGIIDTCSLMNDGLVPFINKHRDFMILNNIRISIIDKIITELKKFTKSSNHEKSYRAKRAVQIINENNDLFETVCCNDKRFINQFADPIILSELIKNKPYYSQVLISNDSALTRDAFGHLNTLQSVYGKRIFVCFLGDDGELHICNCVYNQHAKVDSFTETIKNEKPVEKTIENIVYVTEDTARKKDLAIGFVIGVTSTTLLVNRKPIIKTLTKFGKQLISLAY